MRRTRQITSALLSLLLVAALAVASPTEARARPPETSGTDRSTTGTDSELPDGWSWEPATGATGATVLTWEDDEVRMGGAAPEFRLDGELLGFARETQDGLALALPSDQVAAVSEAPDGLEVWAAGRRLDAPATVTRRGRDPVLRRPPRVVSTDPAAPGPYRTERLTYDLDPLPLDGYPEPIEVLAEVTRPVDARGRRPLVLFLHGRHSTCFAGDPDGEAGGGWPCQDGWQPIPSHLGYRYLTDLLASQGYLTVSISANGINGQDWAAPDLGTSARSQLIRHHLDLWSDWTRRGGDPWGGLFRHRVGLDEVVLVGHSRGGEGVNRAAIDAIGDPRYRIRGLVSYGPTAFGRQVTPDVPAAVILPACDGDVADLQGQAYVDWSRDLAPSEALRSAVLALGANHNYFNTEWTPGLAQAPAWDDWYDSGDPVCGDEGSLRLSPDEQQAVGAAYTLALVRLAVNGERRMLPLLDGTKVKPATIGAAEVSVSSVGGDADLLYRPEAEGMPDLLDGMEGRECPGYRAWSWEQDPWDPSDGPDERACGEGHGEESTPHWQPMMGADTRPAPMALELAWSSPSASVRFPVGTRSKGLDLSRSHTVDVRVANDPELPPAELAVRVRDADGRSAVLASDLEAVDGWPGEGILDRIQARTLRADLSSARRVDLRRTVAVELVATGAGGRVWVLDVSAARQRVADPRPLDLPRVSVTTVQVPEGGPDEVTTVDVEVRVDGRVRRPATVWAQVSPAAGTGDVGPTGFPIELPAGARGVVATVPMSFTGDDVYEPSYGGQEPLDGGRLTLSPLSGAVSGDYLGGVTTLEDEEPPLLSVDVADTTAAEGGSLLWTLRLSGPTSGAAYLFTAEVPGDEVTELDSDDVDQDWLEEQLWWHGIDLDLPIDPPLPLSGIGRDETGSGLPLYVFFEYGQTEAEVEVPIRFDHTAEGAEALAFDLQPSPWYEDLTIPADGMRLTGTVPAHGPTDGLPDWVADAVTITGRFGDTPAEEAAIDAIVGDARVVLAGEVSRGAAEAVEARSGLLADLVERHGLTDLLLDEELPRSVAVARYVALGEGTADGAVAAFADELRRTVEASASFQTLRGLSETAAAPILVLGLDPGREPAALVDLVEVHDPAVGEALACFDLDPEAAGEWYLVPSDERAACRSQLIAARDGLAVEVSATGREGDWFDLHVAHAATVALLAAETLLSVDPAGDGAADVLASLRAEALADGILAVVARTAGRVAAALDDLDAAVLRDVAEPRIVPTSPDEEPAMGSVQVDRSVGAVLVDELGGATVASVGISAGRGEIRAYYRSSIEDRWLTATSLDRPMRGSLERSLSSFGPPGNAFVLPLAGKQELDAEAPMRIGIRDEHRPWHPEAWYVPLRVTEAFDGLVHLRRVRATTLLSQRPWLELDGTPALLLGACHDWTEDRVRLAFDGGTLTATFAYDEWTVWIDATLRIGEHEYHGPLPATAGEVGWSFTGALFGAGEEVVEVAGFVPYELPGC